MIKSAIISEDNKYRYELRRIWDDSKDLVMFIMLNPSTANAEKDDPTIRRCIRFAESWGYGGILVGNLFAYRSQFPETLLLTSDDPIGDKNKDYLVKMSKECDKIICAWGNQHIIDKLSKKFDTYKPLEGILCELNYLELSIDGTPKHPLYLKKDLIPRKYF